MTPTYWRAIDRIGSAPVAALTWSSLLGSEEAATRAFLRRTRNQASTVIDPEAPSRVLDIYPDGETGFVAFGEDRPPLPIAPEEIVETLPNLDALRPALAKTLAFVPTGRTVTIDPLVHHIGIVQPSRGQAVPVMLFLPAGLPTDRANFLRTLASLPPCVLYVPTPRWQRAEAFAIAAGRGISIEALDHRLAAETATTAPVSVATTRGADSAGGFRPIIRVQSGWRWEDVRVRLTTRGTLIASHGSERGEHRFVRSGNAGAVRHFPTIFRQLIEISFSGYWQNPAPTSRTYEKVGKSFLRLRQTIESLIPIPAESFVRDGNRWRPRFQIQLDNEMEASTKRFLSRRGGREDDDSEDE
jgi:hypothetical protein